MAMGAAAHGLAGLARGQRPDWSQLLLTPGNARRLAERLSQMRGAVMKVGQMMSMDGQGVLPADFAQLLGGLRDRAHGMPPAQLHRVLAQHYGKGWRGRFRQFSDTPIAAASIGQAHRAETLDGRVLALKIQYPGVRESIASDIANLGLLARLPGLVPPALDPAALLTRVRQQLEHETDYRAEARAATTYRLCLGDDPVLTVPAVHEAFCTARILATDFAPGVPVDRLAEAGQSQARRNRVATALCRLAVHELFSMRLVQTDPNFGNYLFDAASGRIALLDFGATETVDVSRVAQLRALARALRTGEQAPLRAAALALGFIGAEDPAAQAQGVLDMMLLAGEPLRQRGAYDFGASDLFGRAFSQGRSQFFGAGYARTPPPDLLFLQRKFVGTFMLCTRLRARVDLAKVFGTQID
jgi:predicted unusual protein kinase regulating ubiquinone biosynthesis (AarF/ABC1/UbiB family)